MAYTLENLFNVLHKSIVEDWLAEFDVTEMSLTLSSLSTGLTLLVHATDTESKIVRTWFRIKCYFQWQVCCLNRVLINWFQPLTMIPMLRRKITSSYLLKELNSTSLTCESSAAEYLAICPDCLIGIYLLIYKKCKFKHWSIYLMN